MAKKPKNPKPPGPEAETLKLRGNWEDAFGRAISKPRPPGGWPKSEKKQKPKGK